MNILQIHTDLASGRIQAVVTGLSNELVKRNKVSFCSIFEPREGDVFLRRLDKRIPVYTTHKKTSGASLKYLWRVYLLIRQGGYEVVNMHGCLYYYIIAIFLLHGKTKFYYTIHSDAQRENSGWDRQFVKLKRWFFQKGWVRPITISVESKRSFTDFYKLPSRLIYNGTPKPLVRQIDLEKFRISSNSRILFHPGRITEAKNQKMLCHVCNRLLEEGYDFILLLAGENQNQSIYVDLCDYFSDRIQYLGERNDVIDILGASDGFCLSSIWEGMPMSLLEALSVGCVPICTPVGGIPEAVVDGNNGFLAKSVQEEDYYLALKRFLETDEQTLIKMKQNCIRAFERFDICNTAVHYENYYLEL